MNISYLSDSALTKSVDTRTIETMRTLLKEHFGIEIQQLDLEQPLESLGLDSLAFVEYVFKLEDALQIRLPDVPRDIVTVGAFVAFINSEVSKQSKGGSQT